MSEREKIAGRFRIAGIARSAVMFTPNADPPIVLLYNGDIAETLSNYYAINGRENYLSAAYERVDR